MSTTATPTRRSKPNPIGSAIILKSNVSSPIIAGGMSGPGQQYALRNPLGVPMLIDEILFDVDPYRPLAVGLTRSNYEANGTDLRVQLRLGTDYLCAQYTPIALLGPGKNLSAGCYSYVLTAGAVLYSNSATLLQQQQNAPLFSMPLTSECLLYPGESIYPTFFHAGQINTQSIQPSITVRGRAAPAGARRQSLPWVSYWAGNVQQVGALNFTEETFEGDLVNPHDSPLYVDRMTGVIASTCTQSTGGSAAGTYHPGIYAHQWAVDAGLNYCQLRMVDESGRPIVRDYTPFGHIFQMQDFSWAMRATMPPGSFWKAYLTENYAQIQTPLNTATAVCQAMIGLIGKRMVAG